MSVSGRVINVETGNGVPGVRILIYGSYHSAVLKSTTDNQGNFIIRTLAPILFGFHKSKRFKPDLYIDDGCDLSEYGIDAKIIHIPGHSRGSIGVTTADGDLFCGDLFENGDKPKLNAIMDDRVAAKASIERLLKLDIETIYPGHGKPFDGAVLEKLLQTCLLK